MRKHIIDEVIDKEIMNLLDLGCGDASHLSKHLNGIQLSSYSGYDMLTNVLDIAKGIFFKYQNQCISDYKQWIEQEWLLLETEEKQMVCEHLEQFDYPEEISFYTEIFA